MPLMLSDEERKKYLRHILLPEVGLQGQEKLKSASVLIVGAGGLGSPAALYLAAAGIGKIGIMDFDRVDMTNLQRQIIHGVPDIGRPKVESAKDAIKRISPECVVEVFESKATASNILSILEPYDLLMDGTDNIAARYLLNDAAVLRRIPYVYGSILRFEGQVAIFSTEKGPCYRCLFPKPPPMNLIPNCADAGVFGVLPGVIGTLQATEAIKWILKVGESLAGRILIFDALSMKFRTLRIEKDSECEICSENPKWTTLEEYERYCSLKDSSEKVQLQEISVGQVYEKLKQRKKIQLLDVRSSEEHAISTIDPSTWIPLREVPARLNEIDRNSEIVVFCHYGFRSQEGVKILLASGFSNVKNMAGGIDAWSKEVDPSTPQY